MIRHCVFVKFRTDISPGERDEIYAALNALVDEIPGLLHADFGSNISPEGLAQGFNDGFIMDLADAAARDRYLAHPAHRAAGSKLVAALEGGVSGLMVFDLEIASGAQQAG